MWGVPTGDLVSEDDINCMIQRNYEAYEFVETIFNLYDSPMYRGSVFYANLGCPDEKFELCGLLLAKIWHRDFYTVTIAIRRNETCDLEVDVLLKKRN